MATTLYALVILVCLVLPFHLLVVWQFARWDRPEFFRRHGVVIRRRDALGGTGPVIGSYAGEPVPATVTFKGMTYRFHGVVSPARKVRAGELYLEPRLLYCIVESAEDAAGDRPRHQAATR